jgi:NAD(P)-dependent dehydrogenase (short-subunit alcohol dehydrogenase family)
LGLETARALALRGSAVAMVSRDEDTLNRAVAEVRRDGEHAAGKRGAHPPRVMGIQADAADKDAPHRMAALASDALGAIDVLVVSASTLGPIPLRLLLDTDCEDLEAVLSTNVVGPFRVAKVVVGSMLLRGQGVVVFLSSDAAVEAYPRWGAYGVSKAASDHLARIWGAELAGTGVSVISVDPGEMDTKMHRDAIPDADPHSLTKPERVAQALVDLVERILRRGEITPNGARLRFDGTRIREPEVA